MDGDDVNDDRRCTATSKRTGHRCGRTCPPGFRTCYFHGSGNNVAAKAKAAERLAAAADPAVATVIRLVDSEDQTVALRASTTILDRVPGFGKRGALEVSGHVTITAESIVTVVVGALTDLDVPVDEPRVREVVAAHMRQAGRRSPHLAPVPSDD